MENVPDILKEVLNLFTTFAMIGGGIWLVWGAVVTGGALRDQNGPQIQTGIWQIVGGGLILAAALLFKTLVL